MNQECKTVDYISTICSCTGLEPILNLIGKELNQIGIEGFFVALREEFNEYLKFEKIQLPHEYKNMESSYMDYRIPLNSQDSIVFSFQSNQEKWIDLNSVESSGAITKSRFQLWSICEAMCIPLELDGEKIGVLFAFSQDKNLPEKPLINFHRGQLRHYLPLLKVFWHYEQLKRKESSINSNMQKNQQVLEFMSRINRLSSVQEIYENFLKEIFKLFGFQFGTIMLKEGHELVPVAMEISNKKYSSLLEQVQKITNSFSANKLEGAVCAAFLQDTHFYFNNFQNHRTVPLFPKDRAYMDTIMDTLYSHLLMPIRAEGTPIGVVILSSLESPLHISEQDLKILESICGFIHTALSNARLYQVLERTKNLVVTKQRVIEEDLEMARRIQQNLISKEYQRIKKLDFFVKYLPQSQVGGDIYDIHLMENGKVRIFLADATGHGVQAALTTMLIKSEYERLKEFEMPVHDLLRILNLKFFERYYHLTVFFSCLIIDIDLQEEQFSYASAGHPKQYLLRDNEMIGLDTGGKLIGSLENCEYIEHQLSFKPNDKVVLFTDGLIEIFDSNGLEIDESIFETWLAEARSFSIEKLGENLIHKAHEYSGAKQLHDDLTLVIFSHPTVKS